MCRSRLGGRGASLEQFEERWKRASRGVDFHGKGFFARDEFGRRVKPYERWDDGSARISTEAR